MTMQPVHAIPAGEFKAKCLQILDRVAEGGETYVVTKRGRAVAKLVPLDAVTPRSLRGSVKYQGDIVQSLEDDWPVDP